MAEFVSTKHICKTMREYVKRESRRIRLAGVRSKAVVISFGDDKLLSLKKTLSWADVTTVLCRMKENVSMKECKSRLGEYAADESVHAIIIEGNPPLKVNLQELYDAIPIQKDIMCRGASAVSAMLCANKGAHMPVYSDAVMRVLRESSTEYVQKQAVLFGNCNEIRMLGLMLMNAGAYVSLCGNIDGEAARLASESDILITMLNRPECMGADFFNERQFIVDLGENTNAAGITVGDVVFKEAEMFVQGIASARRNDFRELCDYITVEHVLKSAARGK